jgi:hypothetical protein
LQKWPLPRLCVQSRSTLHCTHAPVSLLHRVAPVTCAQSLLKVHCAQALRPLLQTKPLSHSLLRVQGFEQVFETELQGYAAGQVLPAQLAPWAFTQLPAVLHAWSG